MTRGREDIREVIRRNYAEVALKGSKGGGCCGSGGCGGGTPAAVAWKQHC